jgi:hypothetical protein
MPPAPPPEPLGLGRLVPLAPPLPLLPLLLPGGQFAELLVVLPGMQFSVPMPLPLLPEVPELSEPELPPDPLGIPELLLPPPLVLGLRGLLEPDCAIAVPATEIMVAATGRAMAKRPHSARKRRRAGSISNLSINTSWGFC